MKLYIYRYVCIKSEYRLKVIYNKWKYYFINVAVDKVAVM